MKTFKMIIGGMHCASCGSNIERSIGKISGVRECRISMMTKKGSVVSEDSLSAEEIRKAVSRAGYRVESIEEND